MLQYFNSPEPKSKVISEYCKPHQSHALRAYTFFPGEKLETSDLAIQVRLWMTQLAQIISSIISQNKLETC